MSFDISKAIASRHISDASTIEKNKAVGWASGLKLVHSAETPYSEAAATSAYFDADSPYLPEHFSGVHSESAGGSMCWPASDDLENEAEPFQFFDGSLDVFENPAETEESADDYMRWFASDVENEAEPFQFSDGSLDVFNDPAGTEKFSDDYMGWFAPGDVDDEPEPCQFFDGSLDVFHGAAKTPWPQDIAITQETVDPKTALWEAYLAGDGLGAQWREEVRRFGVNDMADVPKYPEFSNDYLDSVLDQLPDELVNDLAESAGNVYDGDGVGDLIDFFGDDLIDFSEPDDSRAVDLPGQLADKKIPAANDGFSAGKMVEIAREEARISALIQESPSELIYTPLDQEAFPDVPQEIFDYADSPLESVEAEYWLAPELQDKKVGSIFASQFFAKTRPMR
jgi:hypothetical protein